MSHYFPVFLSLSGRPVLIVGGGAVAMEKVESLRSSGATVTVLSPSVGDSVRAEIDAGNVEWISKSFDPSDVTPYFMIIAATDDPATNAFVFKSGNALNRLTNSVDDPENCNFIMSAIVRRGPMQIAVSSSGCSPALAQRLRNRISEELLTPEVGRLGEFLGRWRPAVKSALGTYKQRQGFWERVLRSPVPSLLEVDVMEADTAMTQGLRWAAEHPECLLCGRYETGFRCQEEG